MTLFAAMNADPSRIPSTTHQWLSCPLYTAVGLNDTCERLNGFIVYCEFAIESKEMRVVESIRNACSRQLISFNDRISSRKYLQMCVITFAVDQILKR